VEKAEEQWVLGREDYIAADDDTEHCTYELQMCLLVEAAEAERQRKEKEKRIAIAIVHDYEESHVESANQRIKKEVIGLNDV
jgi:hypothetical protein